MLAKLCLLRPKWLAPWFFGGGCLQRAAVSGWSVSPIQLLLALRTQCLAPLFRRGLWFRQEPFKHCVRNAWFPRFRRGVLFRKRSCEHGRNVRVRKLALVLVLSYELCCSRPWGLLPGRKPSLASPLPSSAQIPPQPSSHRPFTCTTRPS